MSFVSKFLMFTGLLLVVSTICIWIAGGETTKHSTTITIDAVKEQIFPYLTESERIKRWAKDVVEVGSFTQEGPTVQERTIRDESGNMVVVSDELMRFQSPESFSFKSTSNGITQTFVFQLDDNEVDGTNLEYRSARSAVGIGRMFFPFASDNTDSRMVSEMRKLKEIVESDVEQGVAPEIMPPPTDEPEESSSSINADSKPVANVNADAEPRLKESKPESPAAETNIPSASSATDVSIAKPAAISDSKNAVKKPVEDSPKERPSEIASMANGSTASDPNRVERESPKQDIQKQDLSKRKFESLFGTGR
jgi:hypothetical protein